MKYKYKCNNMGSQKRCYIIAEISANHNGSLDAALEMVGIAKRAGADAVKIQTYTADTLTLDSDNEHFRIGGGTLWDGTTLYELYKKAYTPWEWHAPIFAEAKRLGIDCFSTPFDSSAVDFLEQFDPPYYKIASFELNHHPLLMKVARTGRPVILSTGMGTMKEIEESVEVLRVNGCTDITLLKCTSSYPAPASEANLARIPDMVARYRTRVGLSDHTMGITVPIVAVALGATMIEKHFCRSRNEPGPDSAFSLEPDEFAEMVKSVRIAEQAIGTVNYDRSPAEEKSIVFRRSIFVAENMKAGEVINEMNVRVVRPGYGLHPKHYWSILGKKVKQDVRKGTPFTLEMLDPR